jgi:hypothetical protein
MDFIFLNINNKEVIPLPSEIIGKSKSYPRSGAGN